MIKVDWLAVCIALRVVGGVVFLQHWRKKYVTIKVSSFLFAIVACPAKDFELLYIC